MIFLVDESLERVTEVLGPKMVKKWVKNEVGSIYNDPEDSGPAQHATLYASRMSNMRVACGVANHANWPTLSVMLCDCICESHVEHASRMLRRKVCQNAIFCPRTVCRKMAITFDPDMLWGPTTYGWKALSIVYNFYPVVFFPNSNFIIAFWPLQTRSSENGSLTHPFWMAYAHTWLMGPSWNLLDTSLPI